MDDRLENPITPNSLEKGKIGTTTEISQEFDNLGSPGQINPTEMMSPSIEDVRTELVSAGDNNPQEKIIAASESGSNKDKKTGIFGKFIGLFRKNKDHTQVSVGSATIAEEIAKLRTELEQKIIAGGLPPDKWKKEYSKAIARYPETLSYQPIFDDVLRQTLEARRQLDNIWESVHSKRAKSSIEAGVEKADPQAAKLLFDQIFNLSPSVVEAYKGAFTLNFVIPEDEYKILSSKRGEDALGSFGSTKYIEGYKFPIIVMSKSGKPIDPQVFIHELEHAKEKFTHISRKLSINNSIRLAEAILLLKEPIPAKQFIPLRRRVEKEDAWESSLKGELLAFMTILEVKDKLELPDLSNEEIFSFARNTITKSYIPSYQRAFALNQDQTELCKKELDNGVDAFKDLLGFYTSREVPENQAARTTINILEQFPFRYWPAVARLMLSRHHENQSGLENAA